MTMNRRTFSLATVGALVGGATIGLPGLSQAQTPKKGGSLRYGTVTEVASLDPHVYGGSAWKVLMEALYTPLIGFDASGAIVPRVAASWEQPDARTIVFKLRKDARFHDGSSVTPDDVKFSLERILNPATGATLRSNLEGITVSVVDAETVRVEKVVPDATLLSVLAMIEASIAPRKWFEGGANVKTSAMGAGPFRLKQYEPSVRAVLEKNPNYFVAGEPYLDAVEVRMIKSDDARVNALRTGSLDMIDFVPWKDIDVLRRVPNLKVDSSGGAFMNIWFNATRKPFDDAKVRQAVSYAVDREAVSKTAFFGHGTPIYGPPTPSESPYYNKSLDNRYKRDVGKAKQLLASAGFEKGLALELLVFQGLGIYTTTAQVLQANLKEVGIDVSLKLVEWANLMERKNSANYDAMIYGVSMKSVDPDAYSYYFGAESTYWAKPIGYRDEVLEKLLVEGRSITDIAKRKPIYARVEERLLDTSPWTFINYREQAQAYRSNVKGYRHLSGALSESSPGISLPRMWLE